MNRYLLLIPIVFGVAGPGAAEEITYNKHVARILWDNCATCHRPGEVGPFSLLTYEDAAKRADFIHEITASRRMPPWKPEPGFGEFHDARRLTDDQIELIRQWTEAGAPEGDAADLPPQPEFAQGWQLGEPDLVLEMPEEFSIPADARDIYRCFVIPINNDTFKSVAAVEFRPGNRKVVHHAIFYLDDSGQARQKDEADEGLGYTSFGGPGFLPSGSLGGWAPGTTPVRLPDGLAKYMKPKSDLALQIHYHPSGKPETDRSLLGVYFAKEPVERYVTGIPLINLRLNIPPGESRHRVTASQTLPVDIMAVGIFPHMHLLGREMKVTAVLPDGTVEPMIWVKDWDFNWQDQYRYREVRRLPKGTRLELEAFYDNTADNPVNPNDPPKEVRWGEQTTDEMCLCTVQVYTEKPGDVRELVKMPAARLGTALGGALPEADFKDLTLLKKLWQFSRRKLR